MIESLLVACNHINTSSSGKRIQNSPEAERIESLVSQEHAKWASTQQAGQQGQAAGEGKK